MTQLPKSANASLTRIGSWWLIPLGGMLLGLAVIGGHTIAIDESFSWGVAAQDDLGSFWDGLRFVSGNMAGYFVVLRGSLFFGDGLVWMRLPSLVFHVASVVTLIRLADRWYGARTAWFVGVLASTSVPLLYYAVEIRSYALVVLATTMLISTLDRALELDKPRLWWAVGLWAGVALAAHLIVAVMFPVVGLVVWIGGRTGLLGALLRTAPIAVASLPTLVLLALGDSADVEWISALGLRGIATAGRLLLGDHAQFTSEGSGFVLMAAFLAVYLGALADTIRRRRWQERRDWLPWVWLLSMPTLLLGLSFVEPILLNRYLIGSLPAGLLLCARFLAELDNRRLGASVLVILASLGVIRTVALRPHSADSNGELAAELSARAESGDLLVAPVAWHRSGLDYHFRNDAPVDATAAFGPDFDHNRVIERYQRGPSAADFESIPPGARVWVLVRSDSAQPWVETARTAADFDFSVADRSLGASHVLSGEFDVQRFRVRLYEPR